MDKIKKDFNFLRTDKSILGVLLFGSRKRKDFHEKSDTDICIVSPKTAPEKILSKVFTNLNVEEKKYEIHVFEELPLHLKMQVIENHEIIYSKNAPELYEYFYFYRKLWSGQKKRNTMEKKKLIKLLK